MPHLVLIRHGNTFEKDQVATWVGARTDMELTAAGKQQADKIAAEVEQHYLPLAAVLTGPLKRTRHFADLLAKKANIITTLDDRLVEIDYGKWENKSGDQIRAEYGSEALDAWEKDGVWPEKMGWSPSLDILRQNIHGFLDEQHKKLTAPGAVNRVAVTSNGILRFVYRQLTDKAPGPEAKVKTGAYCVLTPREKGWVIDKWNVRPA